MNTPGLALVHMARALQRKPKNIAAASLHHRRRHQSLRWWKLSERTRLLLSMLSLVIGLTIIAIPFSPWILFHALTPEPIFPYRTVLAGSSMLPEISNVAKPEIPRTNRLVIPKIGVDVSIVEGKDERSLSRGIWHLPSTSTPPQGGNTVLTGHRFQYLAGPKTLYLLDQMKEEDLIIVYWQGKEYDYLVKRRSIVNPDAVSILDDTPSPQLTVFTCTPRFTTKQRLVLFAQPITT